VKFFLLDVLDWMKWFFSFEWLRGISVGAYATGRVLNWHDAPFKSLLIVLSSIVLIFGLLWGLYWLITVLFGVRLVFHAPEGAVSHTKCLLVYEEVLYARVGCLFKEAIAIVWVKGLVIFLAGVITGVLIGPYILPNKSER